MPDCQLGIPFPPSVPFILPDLFHSLLVSLTPPLPVTRPGLILLAHARCSTPKFYTLLSGHLVKDPQLDVPPPCTSYCTVRQRDINIHD